MKKIKILLGIFALLLADAMAEAHQKNMDQMEQETNPDLEKTVDEALKFIKKQSPQVSEDALRVWKNFSSKTSTPVNFTYRFWGRQIILWLKDNKKIAFQSEEEVGDVFKILWRKGLISKDAVVVLMVDAWWYLNYLEGKPSWENRMEKKSPEGGMASGVSSRDKSKERDV